MSHLTPRERELVALGAAVGSNCETCIEYHVPQAKKEGLTEAEISEAIRLADRVKQVPARRVLSAAARLLPGQPVGLEAQDSTPNETAKVAATGGRS